METPHDWHKNDVTRSGMDPLQSQIQLEWIDRFPDAARRN
ncbi:MAG: hypothetical protein NVSMB52_20690 [Chloroflexota bacterium]